MRAWKRAIGGGIGRGNRKIRACMKGGKNKNKNEYTEVSVN